jgi:YVTN family beta-propeller protein
MYEIHQRSSKRESDAVAEPGIETSSKSIIQAKGGMVPELPGMGGFRLRRTWDCSSSRLPLIMLIAGLLWLGLATTPMHAQTVVATVATGTSPSQMGVDPVTNKIYVVNHRSNNVTVIDGATNSTTTVTAGVAPGLVTVNPMTNKTYVVNSVNIVPAPPTTVTVIDGTTNATTTLSLGNTEPSAVAVNPVTNKIYVANRHDTNGGHDTGSVNVIDGATNNITTVPVEVAAVALAVNPATNKIYVACNSTVAIIDGDTQAVTSLSLGTHPEEVVLNPVTDKIYVTDNGTGNIAVIDGSTNNTTTVSTGSSRSFDVAVNPVTDKIYVTKMVSTNDPNGVVVIDGATNATTTLNLTRQPGIPVDDIVGIAIDTAANRIYLISLSSFSPLTVINGATNAVSWFQAGISSSQSLAVNPATNRIYVADGSFAGNSLVVIAGAPDSLSPDFTLNASPASLTMAPGDTGSSAIVTNTIGAFNSSISLSVSGLPSGVSAVLSPASFPAPGSGTSTLTFSTSPTVVPGAYTIPVTASGGGISHTINLSLTFTNPTLSVSASPASVFIVPAASGSTTVTTTVQDANFDSDIALSASGLPVNVTASFNPSHIAFPGNGSSTLTFTAGAAAPVSSTNVTVTATGKFGATRTTTVALNVVPVHDFTMTVSPTSLSLLQGSSGNTTVTTATPAGFAGDVSLTVSGLPAGVSASFSPPTIPPPGNGNSILTFTAGSNAAAGTTTNVMITASGSGTTHTVTFPLTITTAAGNSLVYTFPAATTVASVRVVTQGTPNLDFTTGAGTTCVPQSYNAGDQCTVVVEFHPMASGLRTGAVEILDDAGHLVFETLVSQSGIAPQLAMLPGEIDTIAGNGVAGFGGDNGPAVSANLNLPYGVAVDAQGNQYIADLLNHRVRKVSASGIITTIAGIGSDGYSGDGGLAVNAELNQPLGVTVDGAGNLYIADAHNEVIRKIDAVSGIITTVAGNGVPGYSGDGGLATGAQLFFPFRVAVDGAGNLFIADDNNRIRRVDAGTGIITTVAGNGTAGFSGDGGWATNAQLDGPRGVAVDAAGNLYIAEFFNSRIRKVDAATGFIATVAGDGHLPGDGTIPPNTGLGDGGLAVNAHLQHPSAVGVDAAGNLYIADSDDHHVRKVDAATGVINTIAGAPDLGQDLSFCANGIAATLANVREPDDIALDGAGNLYTPDAPNQILREVFATPTARNEIRFQAAVGTRSATQTFTISNIGNQELRLSAISPSLDYFVDFAVTTCSTRNPLPPGSTCLLGVYFLPSQGGTNPGSLTLTDNTLNGTETYPLLGLGLQ